ncbi:MAG: hypothetical protein RBU29_13140, partial [bacterium]|nr:hypothetical protein [bacterium]
NENNKLLVAFDKVGLINFLRQNNFPVTQIPNYEQYIVQPSIAQRELARMQDATIGYQLNAQPLLDQRFRLVDVQEDILTDNPAEKQVSLYDPAGGYIDRFTYRTTFNNAIVDIPNNSANYDLVALPGYKGFESFERSDPTWFDTELKVSRSGVLSAERKVPSSIKLDAKQAIVSLVTLDQGDLALSAIGGYTDTDPNHANMTRFSDIRRPGSVLAGFVDKTWGGWDFLGDFYMYPKDYSDKNLLAMVQLFENSTAMGREAAIPKRSGNLGGQITRFYQMLGGFENFSDVKSGDIASAKKQLTAFTWRMGLRELIRAGYDPNVDDQLTVRVLGRNYVASNGDVLDINMPVGEVMVLPAFAIVNPGNTAATSRLDVPQIYTAANKGVQLTKYVDRSERFLPIFSKLRNGDTAFTINLREQFEALRSDLNNTSGDEPKIEITVFIRKTTRDISPLFVSETENNAEQGYVYPVDRPDLSAIGFPTSGGETAYNVNNNLAGYVATAAGQDYNPSLGALGDDNYFFKGIELFGRNTSQLQAAPDAKLAYLGGTPGWDNTGYVPAYPRRRLQLNGQTRDELDIIDNTAFVKNGPLATVGELSRLFTGNRFETVNMPIIPQRLEDMMFTQARPLTNPELGMRAISDDESRVRLAQRERLDQWENQYSILYDIITTYTESLIPGLININTAPREVLMALPATPLEEPGQLARLQDRFQFNAIVADFILEGREPGGHDMYFGMQDLDDDLFLSTYTRTNTKADTISDYKVYGTGRELRYYKDFDDIQDYLSKFTVEDVRERRVSQFRDMYLATGVSYPDDGPYPDLGTLFSQITHLQRSVRFSKALSRSIDRNWDGQPDGVGDLRERLNTARILARQLTPEDMEEMMNRISNLVTVRSRAFGIITQGRIFDSDGNIVAQRRFETVYKR